MAVILRLGLHLPKNCEDCALFVMIFSGKVRFAWSEENTQTKRLKPKKTEI